MAANPLRGYRLLPGTARRYITPTGQTISRREYDNRRVKLAGWRNRYELESYRRQVAGSRWLGDIYSNTGRAPTFQDYADIREVQARRNRLRAQHGPGTNSELDHYDPDLVAPGGPLDRLLDRAGKRTPTGRQIGNS